MENTLRVNPNDLANMFVLLNGEDMVLYTDASGNTVYKGTVVVEGDDVTISMDPSAQNVFSISTVDGDIISVDSSGNAVFKGAINSNIAIDGSADSSTVMTVTPAAVEELFNVSREAELEIWNGCCETVAIQNIGTIPVTVNAPC